MRNDLSASGLRLLKGGHGIFNVCNDFSASGLRLLTGGYWIFNMRSDLTASGIRLLKDGHGNLTCVTILVRQAFAY